MVQDIQSKLIRLQHLMKAVNQDASFRLPHPEEWLVDMNLMNHGTNEQKDLLTEIEDICCSIFIGTGGHPDREAIRIAKESYGLTVRPLERDSFGWLVAGIRLDAGPTVSFG